MAESQDLVCTGCQKTLRIPARFWGKKVRCPQCQEVLTVPAGVAPVAQTAPPGARVSNPAGGAERGSPTRAKSPPPPPVDALDDVEFMNDEEDPYANLPDQYEFDGPPRPKARSKPKKRSTKSKSKSSGGAFHMEKRMLGAGVLGGIALMAIAVIWFVGGLMGGYIFYYPPIMFVFGFIGMVKGFIRSS